jgi:hypothetical protein
VSRANPSAARNPLRRLASNPAEVIIMKRSLLLLMILGPALVACASTLQRMTDGGFETRYVDYAGAPIERFTAFDLDGWTPVSRNQLVVWSGPNEAYLIKVWDNCRDLMFANGVGITSTTRTISKFEKVRVGRDTCPIDEIRPIDVKQLKADRAAAADARRGAAR